MGFAEGGDSGLERVITENELFLVLASLSGLKVEDQLLNLSNLKDAFGLADWETWWSLYLPLGGLLADVSEDDRFFVVVLYGHQTEVKLVWEVEDRSAAHRANGHNELLTLRDHHQIVRVVALRLREELNDVGDFHAWGDFA